MIEFLIAVVPLLALVGFLLLGRYPGHRAAMRLAERISAVHKTARGRGDRAQPPLPVFEVIRGGLLIAFGRAQRPPPLAP